MGPGVGWLGLVRVASLRIGSFQGGSSFFVKGKATSSLGTGVTVLVTFQLRSGQPPLMTLAS
jgi:hypothetical protein